MQYFGSSYIKKEVNSILETFGKKPNDKIGGIVHFILAIIFIIGILFAIIIAGNSVVQIFSNHFFTKSSNQNPATTTLQSVNVQGNDNATAVGENAKATVNQLINPHTAQYALSTTSRYVVHVLSATSTTVEPIFTATTPNLPDRLCVRVESDVPIISVHPVIGLYSIRYLETSGSSTDAKIFLDCFNSPSNQQHVSINFNGKPKKISDSATTTDLIPFQ